MENCLARSLQYKPFEDRLCDVTGLHRNYQLREIITNTSFPFSLHSVAFFSHPRVCGHHPTRQLPDWPTCMSPSLSVCQFSRMISQKPMQLGSPNFTHKCSIMNHPHLFWGQKVKGQGHETQKTVPMWVLALF